MKILTLHADYITVEPKKKAVKKPEEFKLGNKIEAKNVLVVFTAVEDGDSLEIVKPAIKEIKSIFNQVKAKEILIYPYVHLTKNPSNVELAKQVLDLIVDNLKSKHAPFGWYKSFEIKVKGHPLAELSREIHVEPKTREDVTKKVKSSYLILTPEGKEIEINLNLFKDGGFEKKFPSLTKYVLSEEIKGQPSKEPPSIKFMQKLRLVGYEPASDPGNFRFWPRGNLLFELLRDYSKLVANKLKCQEIRTPMLYNWAEKDIREQAETFHQKHYSISVPDDKKKKLVLRFAGDFGLFKLMKDANLSYKHLPLRIFEISESFRYETRSELAGLRRLRAFTMPDIHSFAKDRLQGWSEYKTIYKAYDDATRALDVEYVVVFRVVKEFYDKYKDQLVELLKYSKKPAFIEILSEMKHYWVVKSEHQGIDSVNGNVQLATVQLDIIDAQRYGITYTNKVGKQKGCIICHCSIGSLERWIYALLEEGLKKKIPLLPIWLSPVQIRVCPITNDHLKFGESLMKKLENENVRVDIDDRNETISKKIHDAEEEWIPLIIVVGDKEVKGKTLAVRFRENGEIKKLNIKGVLKHIKSETKGWPFLPLNEVKYLSKRPHY